MIAAPVCLQNSTDGQFFCFLLCRFSLFSAERPWLTRCNQSDQWLQTEMLHQSVVFKKTGILFTVGHKENTDEDNWKHVLSLALIISLSLLITPIMSLFHWAPMSRDGVETSRSKWKSGNINFIINTRAFTTVAFPLRKKGPLRTKETSVMKRLLWKMTVTFLSLFMKRKQSLGGEPGLRMLSTHLYYLIFLIL